MLKMETQEIHLNGTGASPGICIGKAYLVAREGVDVVEKYTIDANKIKAEIKRFRAAVKKARDELQEIIDNTPEDLRQHFSILETHKVLLKDKMLYGRTIKIIETKRVNAEWALKTAVAKIESMFQEMSDPYLKERAADIGHLADRIMVGLNGAESVKIRKIDKRVILVAQDLSAAQTSQIQLERIKGFITDRGGKTSHTGIIARSLEIPAVVGLGNARRLIQNDDIIVVDGSSGTVIVNPTESTLVEFQERQEQYEKRKASIDRESQYPARTIDGLDLRVMGNIELPEEVFSVINYGGDGIGLYRTEFQYLNQPTFPSEDDLFDKYRDVIEVMAPKPVTIRTLDINGDKKAYTSNYNEVNPALGLRGIRYCLNKPDVFLTQLRAVLRAAVHGQVRVMFPMVSTYSEVIETKKLIQKAAESLAKEGIPYRDTIEIGILIEVPSAVILADIIAEEIDFFSLGTNDLIQYTLAIDRGNWQVAHLFHPFQPAIIRMLHQVVNIAKAKGIKVFMCGEMAGDPISIPIVLGLGFDELSMNPQSIPAVKRVLRSLNAKEARQFTQDVLKLKTTSDIVNLVQDTYGDILGDKLDSYQ